jgi:hypothetical protein
MESEYKAPGTKENLNKEVMAASFPGEDVIQDDSFSYDGYQVVRGEFFAHIREPSITFNNHRVSLNTACLKRLPEVEYVQILVNQNEHKLVVRPSSEDEKDSFIWCTMGEKRKPKQITCRVFFAMIIDLMGWNPDYRYKLLGKLIRSGDEYLFAFDLTSTEIFQRFALEGGKQKTSRTPVFPVEWKNQFGLSVEEHRKRLQVNVFKGYTVFSVNEPQATETASDSAASSNEEENPHVK